MGDNLSSATPAAPNGYVLVTVQADPVPADSTVDRNFSFAVPRFSSVAVNQAAHGFTTGQAVYFNGTTWVLAQANAVGTLGIALVLVVDVNNFTAIFEGQMSGLSGLTPGQYYFVSDAVAGALTTTEPTATSSFSNPILLALTATTGMVLQFRPSAIESTLTNVVNKTTNYTASAGDHVRCDTSAGGFTVTLPASSACTGLRVRVKKVSLDANALVIAAAGADTIDGQASWTITNQYDAVELVSDGAGHWDVV